MSDPPPSGAESAPPASARPAGAVRGVLRSLRVRILVGILAGVVPLFVVSQVVATRLAEREILATTEQRAGDQAQRVASELLGVLRLIEARVQGVASTLRAVDVDAAAVDELGRGLVEADARIYGCAIAFEPGALGPKVTGVAPYVHRAGPGLRRLDLGRPEYDYRRQDWYRLPLESGAPRWSEPYFDAGGGEIWMITYAVPFRLHRASPGGRPSGVVTADLSLTWLQELVARLHVAPGGVAFLSSPGGAFVSHLDPAGAPTSPGGQARLAHLRDAGTSLVRAGRTLGRVRELDGRAVYLAYRAVGDRGWTLGVVSPEGPLLAPARRLLRVQLAFAALALGATVLMIAWVAGKVTRPLEALTRAVERIGQGDLDAALPTAHGATEVAVLTTTVDRMRRSLRQHIEAQAQARAAEARLAGELDIARQIQQSRLPRSTDEGRGSGAYAVSAVLRQAREVGGDLYEFFVLDDGRLLFAVGDVADKGIPAALFMAEVGALLRAMGRHGHAPGRILRELDALLSRDNETCMFVTLGCGILDGATGLLTYASAGHEPPLVRRVGGTPEALDGTGGPPLGLAQGADFPEATARLAPFDTVLVCTDGVTEAFDAHGVPFGRERVRDILTAEATAAPGDLAERVVSAVEGFAAGAPADDITVLAVQHRVRDVAPVPGPAGGWRLTLAARLDEIPRVQAVVEGILLAREVTGDLAGTCRLVVEEIVENVINHAYGGDPARRLTVDVAVAADAVRLRFVDDGPPFDPRSLPPPDLDAPLDDRPIGGLGVWLVLQLATGCEYARLDGHNVLTVTCARAASGDAASPA